MITLNQRVHHLTKQAQKKKNQTAVAEYLKKNTKKSFICYKSSILFWMSWEKVSFLFISIIYNLNPFFIC